MIGDELWDAFVEAVLRHGAAVERTSRFADKQALFIGGREVAHHDGQGLIDVRVTAAGWESLAEEVRTDPAVRRARRRDWVELHLSNPADLDRVAPIIAAAVTHNR